MTIESHDEIHRVYQTITNRDIPCTMQMHFQWSAWKAQGWTVDDLRLVVQHIKEMIRQDRRRPESLRFHNLIGNTERFNEDISEARSLARIRPETPKDRILKASGRPMDIPDNVQTAGQVHQRTKLAAMLREFREGL